MLELLELSEFGFFPASFVWKHVDAHRNHTFKQRQSQNWRMQMFQRTVASFLYPSEHNLADGLKYSRNHGMGF